MTENRICGKCGVEVRPNSMFCYNCGGNVTDAPPVLETVRKTDNLNGIDNPAQTSKLTMPTVAVEPETAKEIAEVKTESKLVEEPEKIEEPKLKSAATMRRQAKSFQKKKVEVVWEEPTGDSLPRLLLVTLLLLVFVGVIVYAAVINK